jgi:hypothetical protein
MTGRPYIVSLFVDMGLQSMSSDLPRPDIRSMPVILTFTCQRERLKVQGIEPYTTYSFGLEPHVRLHVTRNVFYFLLQ